MAASKAAVVARGVLTTRLRSERRAWCRPNHVGEGPAALCAVNVALAHLLPLPEFGICIALSTTAVVVELFTDLGLDRLALLAPATPDPIGYRNTLHSINPDSRPAERRRSLSHWPGESRVCCTLRVVASCFRPLA